MKQPNKIDKLFALEALRKKIVEEMDELKSECSWELEQAYQNEGTTQRRSQYFGKEAGTFSIVFEKAIPEHEEVKYFAEDLDALDKWCDKNRRDVNKYIKANPVEFVEWLTNYSGEIPDGIGRSGCLIEAQPERPKGTRLSVKPNVVFENMGANVFEEVNMLLLGGGQDD